jgi:hypothetical protein
MNEDEYGTAREPDAAKSAAFLLRGFSAYSWEISYTKDAAHEFDPV